MPQNKIVPIMTGLRESEQQRMQAPAGGITLEIKVSKQVAADPQTPVTHVQEHLPGETTTETNLMSKRADVPQTTRTYWISGDGNAGVPGAAAPTSGGPVATFSSFEELKAVASEWPMQFLVEVWNRLPGQRPVTRFENRRVALDRLWRGVQKLDRQTKCTKAGTPASSHKPIERSAAVKSKAECVISLLQAPGGATLTALMEATGWQAHTVRGFLSRKISKEQDLRLESLRRDGQRVYAVSTERS
jgi:hypothetical protein